MERRNTVLLTVIAVATLLVAVVGATFAYFTATTAAQGSAGTTDVQTTAEVKAVGFQKTQLAGKTYLAYPGGVSHFGTQLTISKSADDNSGKDYGVSYSLSLSYVNNTKTAIKYTVYETTSEVTFDAGCTMTPDTSAGNGETRYYYTCTKTAADMATAFGETVLDSGELAAETATNTVITIDDNGAPFTVDTTGTTAVNKYYYVVLEYTNASGAQNDDMGKTISVTLDATTPKVIQK